MAALGVFLAIVGLVVIGVGGWGVVKDGVPWARLKNQNVSAVVVGIGFFFLLIAGLVYPAPDETTTPTDSTTSTIPSTTTG